MPGASPTRLAACEGIAARQHVWGNPTPVDRLLPPPANGPDAGGCQLERHGKDGRSPAHPKFPVRQSCAGLFPVHTPEPRRPHDSVPRRLRDEFEPTPRRALQSVSNLSAWQFAPPHEQPRWRLVIDKAPPPAGGRLSGQALNPLGWDEGPIRTDPAPQAARAHLDG